MIHRPLLLFQSNSSSGSTVSTPWRIAGESTKRSPGPAKRSMQNRSDPGVSREKPSPLKVLSEARRLDQGLNPGVPPGRVYVLRLIAPASRIGISE
jgi:hypothetical protein